MLLEVAVIHPTYVILMREIVMRILIVMVILYVDQITVHHHFLIPMIVAQEVGYCFNVFCQRGVTERGYIHTRPRIGPESGLNCRCFGSVATAALTAIDFNSPHVLQLKNSTI